MVSFRTVLEHLFYLDDLVVRKHCFATFPVVSRYSFLHYRSSSSSSQSKDTVNQFILCCWLFLFCESQQRGQGTRCRRFQLRLVDPDPVIGLPRHSIRQIELCCSLAIWPLLLLTSPTFIASCIRQTRTWTTSFCWSSFEPQGDQRTA